MRYFAVVLLLSSLVFAQKASPSDADGYSWKQWSQEYRLGFVTGYATAMDTAGSWNMLNCMMTLKYLDSAKVDVDKWKNLMCLNNHDTDFDGITMGQFVEGVSVFYGDYRNQKVGVTLALGYVRDEIKGKTGADLDAELTWWRQCAADSSKCSAPPETKTPTTPAVQPH